jgi:hypothetical protein
VERKGFVEACKLARSDLLRRACGRTVAVREVTSRRGAFTVYNFGVANTHTYYAGEGGWWVHNTVCPYQVGRYGYLEGQSRGDGLEVHHAPQYHPLAQAVQGITYRDAPAIVLPYGEHRAIPTLSGPFTGTMQDLLQLTLDDLRNYTGAPQSALDELQDMWRNLGWWP